MIIFNWIDFSIQYSDYRQNNMFLPKLISNFRFFLKKGVHFYVHFVRPAPTLCIWHPKSQRGHKKVDVGSPFPFMKLDQTTTPDFQKFEVCVTNITSPLNF